MGDDGIKDKRMILNGKGWTVQHSACDDDDDDDGGGDDDDDGDVDGDGDDDYDAGDDELSVPACTSPELMRGASAP